MRMNNYHLEFRDARNIAIYALATAVVSAPQEKKK